MGYFDALTSGAFKTAQDGRRLFFPWGVLGSGYELPSEQDYERLRRWVKGYMIVSLVLIIALGMLNAYLVGGIVVVLLMASYAVWAQMVVRGLQPSGERLSMRESMATQAVTHSAGFLWAAMIGAFLLVAGGILLLVFNPDDWLIALASIAFFGLCAASFVRMLVLRYRHAAR